MATCEKKCTDSTVETAVLSPDCKTISRVHRKKNHCIMQRKTQDRHNSTLHKPVPFNFTPKFSASDVSKFMKTVVKSTLEQQDNAETSMEVDSNSKCFNLKLPKTVTSILSDAVTEVEAGSLMTTIDTLRQESKLKDEDLGYALLLAVSRGNSQAVRTLLDNGADPRKYDKWHPLLKSAVTMDHKEIVDILLARGCDPNCTGPDETTLHSATRLGNMNIIRKLVEAGADTEAKTKTQGATPLHLAVVHNKLETVMYLLSLNCEKDVPDTAHHRTPLHWAALYGRTYIAEALIRHGHNQWAIDKQGNFPWSLCLLNNHSGVIRLLVDTIDVNSKIRLSNRYVSLDEQEEAPHNEDSEEPILVVACARGSMEAVKILLKKGADITVKDSKGDTCLMAAIRSSRFQVVRLLCAAKRDEIKTIIHEQNCANKDALGMLMECSVKHPFVLKDLVDAGANINRVVADGNTYAVDNASDMTTLKHLVECGADINIVCGNGNTVLHEAVKCDIDNDRLTCTTYVLDKLNIDISVSESQYKGQTPLQVAIQARNCELVKLMVQAGCSLRHMRSWFDSVAGKTMLSNLTMKGIISQIQCRLGQPRSLMDLSRCSVRTTLGHIDVNSKMNKLPLPTLMKKYLTLDSFLNWKNYVEPFGVSS